MVIRGIEAKQSFLHAKQGSPSKEPEFVGPKILVRKYYLLGVLKTSKFLGYSRRLQFRNENYKTKFTSNLI